MAGGWLLEDLHSRNGTTVDGVEGRIARRILRDGDLIFAGNLIFLFSNPAD
jgi:pSer/pThr/pTyr-binding forkhead associated (FHA) protein